MDETFLRSERFSELLARGDVAPCPDHLDRIARSVPRCRQLVLCRVLLGSELAPWGGSVGVGVGLGTTTGLGIVSGISIGSEPG